jgi:hypothetical protein
MPFVGKRGRIALEMLVGLLGRQIGQAGIGKLSVQPRSLARATGVGEKGTLLGGLE